MDKISKISTEQRNGKTLNIDLVSTLQLVQMINDQDKTVPLAIEKQLNNIARIIDQGHHAILNQGRIIYMGAGTSGRIGVLDASEIFPTFGEKDIFIGLIAGGEKALRLPVENAEDNKNFAVADLKSIKASKKDFVIVIASSGRTPYAIAGLNYANGIGAKTVSISTSQNAKISALSDIAVEAVVGPEVIAGSTRMKSGTAQKLILNMISTGIMIKLGKTYSNLMVDLKSTNKKLDERAISIIMEITKVSYKTARQVFLKSKKNVKIAIVAILTKTSCAKAGKLLKANDYQLRKIID